MVKIDWFYDDIGFTSVTKKDLEEIIGKKKDLIETVYSHVKEVEGEAYINLVELKPQPGYTRRYIDVMVVTNTAMIRLVRERSERPEDVERKVTMLGELSIEDNITGHEHAHEGAGYRDVDVEWYKDILEYLQVTIDEVQEYRQLISKNAGRIIACLNYTYETPDVDYYVLLKAWSTQSIQGRITRHVSAHAVNGKAYLIYSEEYEQFGEYMIYYFRLGRIITSQ